MTDPIRAALDKAACEICICEGECFETRHGMMHGPCEKFTGEAADAIATFLRALPDGTAIVAIARSTAKNRWQDTLADAVLAAAKEDQK